MPHVLNSRANVDTWPSPTQTVFGSELRVRSNRGWHFGDYAEPSQQHGQGFPARRGRAAKSTSAAATRSTAFGIYDIMASTTPPFT